MKTKMTMVYWKGEKFWLGKLLEYPEIMTQGETLEALEENTKDAYLLMAMDDVPEGQRGFPHRQGPPAPSRRQALSIRDRAGRQGALICRNRNRPQAVRLRPH